MRKLLIILGVPIDDLTMSEALDRLEQFIAVGRKSGTSHQIATVNADFVVNALHDPELRYILQQADMTTADGTPLVLGARLLGVPLAGRVTGADLVPALAERAAQKGYSLFLLGARPGVAAQAGKILQERNPGLKIAGIVSPPNTSVLDMDPAIVEELKAARPDILLVAFGNPKQEKWISMYARQLNIPVCIGIGGTLDMIAGVTRRAPAWVQNAGFEWLYRLMQEPRRLWKRYVLDLFYFGTFFVRQWWAMRQDRSRPAPGATQDIVSLYPPPEPAAPEAPAAPQATAPNPIEQVGIVAIHGRLDVSNQEAFARQAEQALALVPMLAIDMAQATFLDSSALGTLVALTNRARAAGGGLWLINVPANIRQILTLVRLDTFFEIHDGIEQLLAHQQHTADNQQAEIEHEGWSVIAMPRMLDADTAPLMIGRCSECLEKNPRIILDFSNTVLLSSAGMAALVTLNRTSRERGGEMRVAGCSHDVLHGIKLVRLDGMLPLYQDVQAAIT